MRQHKNINTLICMILSLILSSYAYSGNDLDHFCEIFVINISNKTTKGCVLESYQPLAGYISTNIKNFNLPPNGSHNFVMRQGNGPGSTLQTTYSCEGKKIILESHQGWCFQYAAGDVSGKLISADRDITAKFTTKSPSYWLNAPGKITWTIS